ncbi:uncharacterized protein LOC127855453 [Dreissena polymorpha]|uniref:EGF-like domain-containing protein n=1 Tax=Dreissena polymorpha TaxID=45954 RepID=A0A9D4C9Y4_DREPO|nr:uncharacterized protein LOC127855453 [Dreissena polymorpha]KAH3719842.1 hypothetical protein DPMN_062726 [Dreissena polymorpha]
MFVYVIISSCIVAIVAASCDPNPCQNGGTCNLPQFPNDSARFFCICTSGWDGRFCQTPFRYIGCFEDSPYRFMTILLPPSNSNSPLECAGRCQGYPYSGTQVGNECCCGDSLNADKKPDSECNSVCPGDLSKTCGGPFRMSVYSIIE